MNKQNTFARHPARNLVTVLLALVFVCLWAGKAVAGPIRIGGKNFTEQLILSSMTSQYLRAKGYGTELTGGLGSTLMRTAHETGELDVVWEYTGTSLIVYNRVLEKMDGEQTYHRVRELDAAKGLIWLDRSRINNTYALAMPRKRAEAAGLHKLSELAQRIQASAGRDDDDSGKHTFAIDMEFAARPDGLQPLKKLYGFSWTRRQVIQLDPGLVYTALRNDQVETGLVYATDGRIKGFDLVLLEDDKGFFPAYHAAPVARKAVLDANPQLAAQLNALAAVLDNETMTEMNYQVDIEQKPVDQVAAAFLRERGLL